MRQFRGLVAKSAVKMHDVHFILTLCSQQDSSAIALVKQALLVFAVHCGGDVNMIEVLLKEVSIFFGVLESLIFPVSGFSA